MARNRPYNPLGCVPPAHVVEANLRLAQESVRQLKILLRTARGIERKDRSPKLVPPTETRVAVKGGRNAS